MRVIVCGAGQAGSTIARHLATEGIDVTVLDSAPDAARRADESYDVRGMVGYASHPEALERAGARGADMLIAVTSSNEVNMVACQFAYSLFGVRQIEQLARLRFRKGERRALVAVDRWPLDLGDRVLRGVAVPHQMLVERRQRREPLRIVEAAARAPSRM